MADELKTDVQPTTELKGSETTVTISQEKLDSLINEKFKKGAEKANSQLLETLGVDSVDSLKEILQAKKQSDEAAKTELEKALEAAEQLKQEQETLRQKYETAEKKNMLNSIASKHGVKEVDYFELELNKVDRGEDFDMDAFVENLKVSKPSLFGEVKAPKTDTSSNNSDPADFKTKIQGLSFAELQKLQASL